MQAASWGVHMLIRLLVFMQKHGDDGATAVEYAIMAGLIAVVIASSVGLFGQAVVRLFQQVPLGVFGG